MVKCVREEFNSSQRKTYPETRAIELDMPNLTFHKSDLKETFLLPLLFMIMLNLIFYEI